MVPRLGKRFRMLIQDHQIATMKCWSILLENNHEHLYCSSGPVLDTKPVSTLDNPCPWLVWTFSHRESIKLSHRKSFNNVMTFSKKVPLEPEKMKELTPSPKGRGIDLLSFETHQLILTSGFSCSRVVFGYCKPFPRRCLASCWTSIARGKKQQCCGFEGVGLCCCGWLKRNGWLTRYDIYVQTRYDMVNTWSLHLKMVVKGWLKQQGRSPNQYWNYETEWLGHLLA